MKVACSYHPAARAEVDEAAGWLDERDSSVADRFLSDLEMDVESICAVPKAFPLWPGIAKSLQVRRCVMKTFAFSIAFLVEDGKVTVLAVAHQRRKPRYWTERLRSRG